MKTGERSPEHDELEASFFRDSRGALRERLREAERTRTDQMAALAEISGIEDVEVLEKLVVNGVRSETLAALTLYPLVAVAWADGRVDRYERREVLRNAESCGVRPGSISHELFAAWLDDKPDAVLFEAWQALVQEIARRVEPDWRAVFARELLSRAHAVAEASGAFLALEKTSHEEQRVLDRLRAAFA